MTAPHTNSTDMEAGRQRSAAGAIAGHPVNNTAQHVDEDELQRTEALLGEADAEEELVVPASYGEIAKHFAYLGWTAFGGPAAHVNMFLKLFVEKLRWTTVLVFTELLMLGQCIPGPTSTQMSFALGVLKKGISGGLMSGMLFQAPGLIILTILGWAASKLLEEPAAWLQGVVAGLAAAGIALVASAARELVGKNCKESLLQVICTTAAVVAFYYPRPWIFPSLILLGGIITICCRREVVKVDRMRAGVEKLGLTKLGGAVLLVCWAAVLVVVLVLANRTDYETYKELHWFAAFYRTGSIIFGGGQVVLPMLYNDVVGAQGERAWMTSEQFYAGLALAQAMPGPLFNFSAYLGAVLALNTAKVFVLVGVAVCWIGLFAPGIILIFGILPWWGMFRQWQIYRRALPGLNSAAVGLIVTSVFQLTLNAYKKSPFPSATISIGILAYGATEALAIPAPLVVLGGGLCGLIGWAAHMV